MSRSTILTVVVIAAVLLLPLAYSLLNGPREDQPRTGATTPLHTAAANGNVDGLLNEGTAVNAVDELGRTPLHLSALNGHVQTSRTLLEHGASADAIDTAGKRPLDYARANDHTATAAVIEAYTTVVGTQGLNPSLPYPDLRRFEAAIGQPGCLLESEHVYVFAPKSREHAAKIVMPYLVAAYDALYDIVGVHTDYIIVVYNFPAGHSDAWGGTSNCTLWYDDTNLDLEQHDEWTQHGVPHVAGYIEEMAHNFVGATRAQFGWEMVGWSIGAEVTERVASNAVHDHDLRATRQRQAETFRRYRQNDFMFPGDIEPNQVDRIHAYILWECAQQYGPNFWNDFFGEVRKEKRELLASEGDRDRRYQITVDCFDRLPGLNFRRRLAENHISLTRDIKSLRPTEPGWNHRLE